MRVVQFGEAQPNELQLLSRRVGGGVGKVHDRVGVAGAC